MALIDFYRFRLTNKYILSYRFLMDAHFVFMVIGWRKAKDKIVQHFLKIHHAPNYMQFIWLIWVDETNFNKTSKKKKKISIKNNKEKQQPFMQVSTTLISKMVQQMSPVRMKSCIDSITKFVNATESIQFNWIDIILMISEIALPTMVKFPEIISMLQRKRVIFSITR